MAIKLEHVLIVIIVVLITGIFMIKIQNTPPPVSAFTKELEFTDTTLIEVDTKDMQSRAYIKHGIRDRGILTLADIVYMSDNIESLSANNGVFYGNKLYLDGDVILQEKGGYRYKTEHAIYDQKTEILSITSPFTGVKGLNMIQGESLEYDTRLKKASGSTVGTIFYTPDK
ncbi:MAG TPA: hypothetical protein VIN02_01430 [Sulfurovum sp.]